MKCAFLDADFVMKSYIIRKDDLDYLIDHILNLDGYEFFCHQQTLKEIKRHNPEAYDWYLEQIQRKRVSLLTDEQIVQELIECYRKEALGIYSYTDLLRNACDTVSSSYFPRYYDMLDKLDYNSIGTMEFCEKLRELDAEIGEGKNLGEIKTFVLMSCISIKTGEPLLYFCSDDNAARQGSLGIQDFDVQCISIMSAFYWLLKEKGYDYSMAEPFLKSMIQFNRNAGANTTRIRDGAKGNRILHLDYETVVEDLYKGQFRLSADGYLTYLDKQ